MKKLTKIAALVTLMTVGVSANAFWGSDRNSGWGNDGFGDASGDFSMSFGMSANGSGRGYGRGYDRGYDQGYYNPYGYAPYGYGQPTAAPVSAKAEPK